MLGRQVLLVAFLGAVSVSWGATIEIESVEARRGEAVEVAVVLRAEGDEVAGTENSIEFDSGLYPLECWGNSAIEKEVSLFSLSPGGCSDRECRSVKALVLSFRNLGRIDDGATLYWCLVRIDPSAEPGDLVLRCHEPATSTGDGNGLETACIDGFIAVSDEPAVPIIPVTPRPTPTPFPVEPTSARPPTPTRGPPTLTPTPSGLRRVFVALAPRFVSAERGGQAEVRVTVRESNNELVEGEVVRFELDPVIAGAIPRSARTGSTESGGDPAGVAMVTIDVPPGSPDGPLVIRAEVSGGIGFATLQLFAGESPPVTPTPTPSSAAPPQGRLLVDTSLASVSAESGAEVRVRAFVRDLLGAPLNGVFVSFDLVGGIGEIESVSELSGREIIDGREVDGVVEAILRVSPASPTGRIQISARAPELLASGVAFVSVVFGDPAALIQEVLVEFEDGVCGQSALPLEIEVRARVFDSKGDARLGREVSFESEIGQIFPTIATTERVESRGILARSTLFLPLGTPVRHDPATGAVLPWTIRARAEGVEGVGQLFLLPGRTPCDGGTTVPSSHDSDDGCSIVGFDGGSRGGPLVGFLLLWLAIRAGREPDRPLPSGSPDGRPRRLNRCSWRHD